MFQSAAAKLTLWYLCIVMLVSGVFSFALYRVSFGQINENAAHQRDQISHIPLPPSFEARRTQVLQTLDDELDSAQQSLIIRLLILNAGMLLFGGAASYILARLTLQPIQHAMEMQGRFTADASHELRTPLTAMRTEIEVALRDHQLPASDARDLLGSNLEEIAKLEALSAGLLRLARSENGLDPAVVSTAKVADIINDAAERYIAAINKHDMNLEIKAGSEAVSGDRDSLVELVAILLDNAIKYSPDGAGITITSAASGQQIKLTLADQGAGIKASDLPYIFNRFYRADRSRARSSVGGYGLGLSIAQRIVDLHHGSISADSTVGKGTTFTVKLPVRPAITRAAASGWGQTVHGWAAWFGRVAQHTPLKRSKRS